MFFTNLLLFKTEMKKILTFVVMSVICIFSAGAVSRVEKTPTREKQTTNVASEKKSRATTVTKTWGNTAARTTQSMHVLGQTKPESSSQHQRSVATRSGTKASRTAVSRNNIASQKKVVSRATMNQTDSPTETKIGAEYEKCKSAFFTCMDQFCEMKNDNFKRCSCSDRIYKLQDIYESYEQINTNLAEFTENLNVVGMTYEQAKAMKTATEGEKALTEDKSASKQLLQAIMNAIKGEDASVGGKYKDLNSLKISSDITNAFGLDDSGQIVASYNGTTLYKSVFPACKSITKDICNNASLQRAANAYLMAIEQDCNTVESALVNQQKTLKAATHENSAMLDLARIENRRAHNSDDIATCIANIEKAITNDDVCGENYYKCLDYGQFIDVTTGAPLTGVVDFYKLGNLLTFKTAENLENQKLSSVPDNRKFVQFFENKTKKFAQTALNKCTEKSDDAWREYLDMALIDIYYAQQSKVDKIEQSCFELVTACYNNQDTAIASAMANLSGDNSILLKPAAIDLTNQICSDYIESCNNMFDGDVVKMYIANKKATDSETACRAVAQQCFDKFGGIGYENFYSPQSGLFTSGAALDWFSLYDNDHNIVSPCAKELLDTEGCADDELIEKVFGGFDKKIASNNVPVYTIDDITNAYYENRKIRPRGVASEIYTKIINNLSVQCEDINGYFVEYQYAERYDYNPNNFCQINTYSANSIFYINKTYISDRSLDYWYKFIENENMCPADYSTKVDVQSWGACSCWENGGYRSGNGNTQTCRPLLPISGINDNSFLSCTDELLNQDIDVPTPENTQWCQQSTKSSLSQICPEMNIRKLNKTSYVLCANRNNEIIQPVLEYVRQHKATESEISKVHGYVIQQQIINSADLDQLSGESQY